MIAGRELRETVRDPARETTVTSEHRTGMRVGAVDPAAAVATGWDRRTLRARDLTVECTAVAELRSDAGSFFLDLTLDVTRDGAPYSRRRWVRTIPRRLL
jgi:hypothetical protein